ncbi:MAG: hypothetical protein H0X24_17280 [Ktedonobacterales bacterium]|nr:hypothetical protein [Ktedonobacterales bacterium]
MVALTIFGAIRQTLGRSLRNGFFGLIIGGALVEGLATLLNKSDVTLQNLAVSTSSNTLFVHVAAILLALAMGSLFTVWTVAVRTVQGVVKGADNAVDAVDGPSRHGLF